MYVYLCALVVTILTEFLNIWYKYSFLQSLRQIRWSKESYNINFDVLSSFDQIFCFWGLQELFFNVFSLKLAFNKIKYLNSIKFNINSKFLYFIMLRKITYKLLRKKIKDYVCKVILITAINKN